MTTITIQFDNSGESQVFEATRPIRNSEHANGTIDAGEQVFFRRDPESGRVALLCANTGEPTNGNQYAEWASAHEAVDFAARVGLVDAE